jgi:adenylate kinase family enzyme
MMKLLVNKASLTQFGKAHQFHKIVTYYDFSHQIPLMNSEDLLPYISDIQKGAKDVLWPGRPRYLLTDCKNPEARGFIFDGFPRTIAQAEALDLLLLERGHKVSGLVALDVSEEEIIKRILLRGKSSGRADDSDSEIIRNRITIYKEETSQVYDYYAANGKSHTVNGLGSESEIFERLCAVIDNFGIDWFLEEEE